MQLEKSAQITVFKLDDGTFESLGEVNKFSSLIWPDKFNGYATFELWAPITEENAEYFKQGNILWCGGDNAAQIEIVKSDISTDGEESYHVKGRTLEMLLTTRIIWNTYNGINKHTSTVMYEIVNQSCVNPVDSKRKIPFLELAVDKQFGDIITTQKTGGEVYDALVTYASNADIGFNILFRPREKKLIFEVVPGVDRTVEQLLVDPVEFSTELDDILSSSYYTNDQDKKTVALVMGEGEGTGRKSQISGNNNLSGFARRELYVDARDLQSETSDENGNMVSLTVEEYNRALVNRGDTKLSERQVTETFEAKIRVIGSQYTFGKDFFKGDKVTIRDNKLGVKVSAHISEVEEAFGDKYELVLTFGYSFPTVMQRVKQGLT